MVEQPPGQYLIEHDEDEEGDHEDEYEYEDGRYD